MPAQDDGGQVSEASSLEHADERIMPDQAVAGSPDAESGDAQEGKAGPNAQSGNDATGDNDDETDDSPPTTPEVVRGQAVRSDCS